MTRLEKLLGLLAVAAIGCAGFEACIIADISAQAKAAPTVLLCFDAAGQVTSGSDWTECHRVKFPTAKGSR